MGYMIASDCGLLVVIGRHLSLQPSQKIMEKSAINSVPRLKMVFCGSVCIVNNVNYDMFTNLVAVLLVMAAILNHPVTGLIMMTHHNLSAFIAFPFNFVWANEINA